MSLRNAAGLLCLVLTACAEDSERTDTGTAPTGGRCVDGVGVLSGTYTEDLTLTADCAWLLSGGVIIGDDENPTTLTIEPGTTVYGESATNGFLVIRRHARIEAVGTATAPIVFTSDQEVGSRGRGDWGGLVINGLAPINACNDGTPDCEAEGEGGTGKYGGADPDDDSGTLSYVRVEYGGTEISPDNEINGLTLAGVGRGTTLDHLQIHANLDDGVEFFGGTAEVKYLVSSCVGDDGIDWDLGFQGNIQYALVAQCSDAGNNGIEADNNEADHAASPRSGPTVSNLTLIGSPSVAEDNFGVLLRRGTDATITHAIAMGFSLGCLAVRDDETYGAEPSFEHTLLACAAAFEGDDVTDVMQEEDVFGAGTGNGTDDPQLADTALSDDPDFRPSASGPAATGGAGPSDPFFDAPRFLGAFDPMGSDWTDGWTNFAQR